MKYAYCRVSTEHQSLKRQLDNIAAAFPDIAERNYYTEKYTGTTANRPAWTRLLARVQPGDTIVFDSVSRMSRDAAEGAKQYEELYSKGVSLVFLNEPHINTDVFRAATEKRIQLTIETGREASDKFVNGMLELLNQFSIDLAKEQVMLAFEQAQKERDDLSKRTRDGIRAAMKRRRELGLPLPGYNRGRKFETKTAAAAKEVIQQHSKFFGGTLSDADCIKLAGCSRNSYYKYKAELKASLLAVDDAGQDPAEAAAAS